LRIRSLLDVVRSGDLTTGIAGGDTAPAQRGNELQQLAQADQAELRITSQILALTRPVGISPAPRQL